MTAVSTGRDRTPTVWQRARNVYETHKDFALLLGLFSVLQLMLLAFFAPGGRFGDYSDYWYYQEMASRLDSGYYPYLHYWVEYPPLFPWLPVLAYWLSRLVPTAPSPQLWFYVTYGGLMGLFGIGNLVMVYILGLELYDRPRALRCAWFYALLFGPLFVHAGWFDGVALFFMLLSLHLLFQNRAVLSGMAAGLGGMVKLLPLVLVPVGFKVLTRRWRYVVSLGLVLAAVNLPFYLLNPALFVASWRALLTVPSWETVWALLDGYYSYGLALGNRFDPAQAGSGQRPELVPWWVVLALFGLAYALVYFLPWERRRPDRPGESQGTGRRWPQSILEQFRRPVMSDGIQAVDRKGVVAFVGLGLNLFMVFSKGYSPQFVLWYLPILVLILPNGWGLAYATVLTVLSVVERVFYFFVLPDAHWLLAGTVLLRTMLMLVLIPEYLAQMRILSVRSWQNARRWILLLMTLLTLVGLVLGTRAFIRDYYQLRYEKSSQRHVVDRIRADGLAGDGVVATSRTAFDAMASFLPDQEVRLYTREDGEFRSAAFGAQWADFVARHPGIWLLLDYTGGQNADWNVHLTELLAEIGYETTDEWVGPEQRLVHYAVGPPASTRVENVDAQFGEDFTLLTLKLEGRPLRGGEVLRLALQWQAASGSDAEYKVFVHLVSDRGQILSQRDVPLPMDGQAVRTGLLLPRDLAPGAFDLRIGVYNPVTGQRLTLSSGADSLVLEGIQVND